MSELKMMTHLGSHENIVNLLGACTLSGNRFPLRSPRRKHFSLETKMVFVVLFLSFSQSQCGPPNPSGIRHTVLPG